MFDEIRRCLQKLSRRNFLNSCDWREVSASEFGVTLSSVKLWHDMCYSKQAGEKFLRPRIDLTKMLQPHTRAPSITPVPYRKPHNLRTQYSTCFNQFTCFKRKCVEVCSAKRLENSQKVLSINEVQHKYTYLLMLKTFREVNFHIKKTSAQKISNFTINIIHPYPLPTLRRIGRILKFRAIV